MKWWLLASAITVATLAAPSAVAQDANLYVAHIASYRTLESAQAGFEDLKSKVPQLFKDAKPYIHRVDLGEKGIWYRVQVGPPTNEPAMRRFCEQLNRA